jgi:hypothetical protein
MFLNAIAESELLKGSQELHTFLDPASEKSFQIMRRTRAKRPTKLKDFISLNGHLDLDLTTDREECDKLEDYMGLIEILRKRLKA